MDIAGTSRDKVVPAAGTRHWRSLGRSCARTVAGNSQLMVANAGTLISPADAERIFEPFQRLDDRASHDGFGLGLTMVVSIAAVHGGTATACPRDDGGLSVTVSIPSLGSPAHEQAFRRPKNRLSHNNRNASPFEASAARSQLAAHVRGIRARPALLGGGAR
jgi:Histidine kinase-, DNA gyrase B-, and HSP90-like ATPase